MDEEYKKLEEIYKEIIESRVIRKEVTWTATQSVRSSSYSNIVNFDFASLYASTFTMNLSSRMVKRMNKINKIFNL